MVSRGALAQLNGRRGAIDAAWVYLLHIERSPSKILTAPLAQS